MTRPDRIERTFVPPDPPKTPKAAGTRRRLLEHASALFIEHGYYAVSLRDIAEAAGLTKNAVYGHFQSKGQLFIEVIRWRIALEDDQVDFAAAVADPAQGVRSLFSSQGRETRVLQVDAAAAARHDADIAAGLSELTLERQQRIADMFTEDSDAEIVSWLLVVLSFGIGAWNATDLPLPPADRLAPVLLATIEAATAPGPPSA